MRLHPAQEQSEAAPRSHALPGPRRPGSVYPGAGARSRGAAERAAQLLPPPGRPLPSPRGCPAGAPHGRSRRAPGPCCWRRCGGG